VPEAARAKALTMISGTFSASVISHTALAMPPKNWL
jgi:hypothetical protein